MNWRRIVKWLAIVTVIGFVAVFVTAWIVAGTLVAPANRTVGHPPEEYPAAKVQFESDSGASIEGWHLPVHNSNATAIFLHPFRGDRRSMLTRAKLFQKYEYSTLLFDFQAHGESVGEAITLGKLESHDVIAAVNFIRRARPDHKIVIVGRSLGGASAVFANPDVDAIVLESVYPTISDAIHNRIKMRLGLLHHLVAPMFLTQLKIRLGVSYDQLRPIAWLEKLECPVIIASGDCDLHTSLEETQSMFEKALEPKQLVIFKGAGHVDLLAHDPVKYENEVVGFVNSVIGDRTKLAE